MSHKKPEPLIQKRKPELCPVCNKVSYSRFGIHPQCEVLLADAKRTASINQKKQTKLAEKKASGAKMWQKTCPECNELQHVRLKTCTCGHTFAVQKNS